MNATDLAEQGPSVKNKKDKQPLWRLSFFNVQRIAKSVEFAYKINGFGNPLYIMRVNGMLYALFQRNPIFPK